jgi:hypothetical protein
MVGLATKLITKQGFYSLMVKMGNMSTSTVKL